MSTQVQVNVTALVNKARVRREKRNGRDVVIVPSVTMPDNIVMNGSKGPVLYPAEEIAKSFHQLERTPAPFGHPTVNGRFVSASDPEGLNLGYIGAWNENVRQEGGRVMLDKVIDVEVANRSADGARVLAALDGAAPVHTSTGLLATLEVVNAAGARHKHVARNLVFDHDAILLDEPGAATPDDGVGIFVNSAAQEIEVLNASLSDDLGDTIDWLADDLATRATREDRLPLLEKLKSAMKAAIDSVTGPPAAAEETNVDQKQFETLANQMGEVATAITALATALPEQVSAAVTNAMKPMADAAAADAQARADKEAADKADAVSKVVNAGLLDQADAEATPLAVLNSLAAKNATPGKALTVNRGTTTPTAPGGFKAPAGEE